MYNTDTGISTTLIIVLIVLFIAWIAWMVVWIIVWKNGLRDKVVWKVLLGSFFTLGIIGAIIGFV